MEGGVGGDHYQQSISRDYQGHNGFASRGEGGIGHRRAKSTLSQSPEIKKEIFSTSKRGRQKITKLSTKTPEGGHDIRKGEHLGKIKKGHKENS